MDFVNTKMCALYFDKTYSVWRDSDSTFYILQPKTLVCHFFFFCSFLTTKLSIHSVFHSVRFNLRPRLQVHDTLKDSFDEGGAGSACH